MGEDLLLREARERAGLTQRALAAAAGTSQPAIARYESGRVSPRAATRDRLLAACGYQLNPRLERRTLAAGPVATLVIAHRGAIRRIAAQHGVKNVRVFGSVARGQDRPDSDLDLLATLDPGRTLLDLAAAKTDLEALLEVTVDLTTLDLLKPHIRAGALHDQIPL